MSESRPDSARRPPLSPLEGGRWRPVQPDELLRRNGQSSLAPESGMADAPTQPVIQVHRRQELERIIKDRPADAAPYLELATIYRHLGRSVEATRVLKAALDVDPNDEQILWQLEEASLARSLQQLKDVRDVARRLNTPEAERELERAQIDWANRRVQVCRDRLRRDSQADHLRVVLTEALRDLGEYDQAVEAIQPALENDAEAPKAYLLLGQCQEIQGRHLAALSAFRHAAMRRAVPAPLKIRLTATRAALDLAHRMGLNASADLYRQAFQQAQREGQQARRDGQPADPIETQAKRQGSPSSADASIVTMDSHAETPRQPPGTSPSTDPTHPQTDS